MLFHENQHYGHSQILLNHCGFPTDTPIPHRIQHGWQPGPGMSAAHMSEPGSKMLWSSRNLASCHEQGFVDGVAIGAPFLYLPEPPSVVPPAQRSVLAIPFHGWKDGELQGSVTQYADELTQLTREGFGPITVCMYSFEYEQKALRSLFEARGFETTTMGHRTENPEFLQRQRALISNHGCVTSNRVSTATFYALSLGVPFFLWGQVHGVHGSDDPSGEAFDTWQRRTYPELTRDEFDGTCHQGLGMRELGAEHLRSPRELIDTLHLGGGNRGARALLGGRRFFHGTLCALKIR